MKLKLNLPLLFLMLFSFSFVANASPSFEEMPMKRLKIAYVIDSYDQLKSGGIISANRFIQELRKHCDVTVVSTGEEKAGKVSVHGFYPPFAKDKMKKNGMKFGFPNSKKLKNLFKHVDLVYVHLPFYLGIRAVRIAKDMGRPVIVGFHLQPENLLLNVGIKSKIISQQLYNFFIRKFYNRADLVICPSEFAERLLRGNKNFTGKTAVISNGLTGEFRPQTLEKFPQFQDKFVVLTVGRLAKEKRHDLIINAINRSKHRDQIQLVITGDGVLKDELIDLSRVLPNRPQVGFVSKEDLIRLYNTSDLYIHASEIELEGMSVLEAIGCGLPAIISDAKTSASKQFALNKEFLFASGKVVELAAKIDYWFEHRMELAEISGLYAEKAKKYYFENSMAKMLSVFDQVASQKSI